MTSKIIQKRVSKKEDSQKQKWISTSSRNSDTARDVLILTPGKIVKTACCDDGPEGHVLWYTSDFDRCYPTHWTEIPELPKKTVDTE